MADESLFEPAIEEFIPAPTPLRLAPEVFAPFAFEFTGEDALRLTVHNTQTGVVVAVHYRMHRRGQSTHANAHRLAPTSDGVASTSDFSLGAGYLHNVTVFASSGTPRAAQTFVRLQVVRGSGAAAIVLGTLVQGYVTANMDRAWPGSPIQESTAVEPLPRILDGTNPAAGAEISETVPTNRRWQLVTLQAELVTDANVATREPRLVGAVSGAGEFLSPSAGTVGFSSGATFSWQQGMPHETVIRAAFPVAGLPSGCWLTAGAVIATATNNLQAGDNWGTPRLVLRELLEV